MLQDDTVLSEEEEEEEDAVDEEMDNEVEEPKTSPEPKKVVAKEIKKESKSDAEVRLWVLGCKEVEFYSQELYPFIFIRRKQMMK